MVVGPAAVAEIANLQLEVFAKLWTAALRPVLLNLVLDLPWVEQVKLEVRDTEGGTKLIIASFVGLLRGGSPTCLCCLLLLLEFLKFVLDANLLTLLELLSILEKLGELGFIGLILC